MDDAPPTNTREVVDGYCDTRLCPADAAVTVTLRGRAEPLRWCRHHWQVTRMWEKLPKSVVRVVGDDSDHAVIRKVNA